MLYSVMRRYADAHEPAIADEMKQRKEAYDKAFAEWNSNFSAYALALRTSGVGEDGAPALVGAYTQFEEYLQKSLVVGIFQPLDACLTEAYDASTHTKPPRAPMLVVEDCQAVPLLKQARICGYAITEQLHLLTYAPDHIEIGLAAIKQKCPLPSGATLNGREDE